MLFITFPNQGTIFGYKKSNQVVTLLKKNIQGGWKMISPFSLRERRGYKVVRQTAHGGFSL